MDFFIIEKKSKKIPKCVLWGGKTKSYFFLFIGASSKVWKSQEFLGIGCLKIFFRKGWRVKIDRKVSVRPYRRPDREVHRNIHRLKTVFFRLHCQLTRICAFYYSRCKTARDIIHAVLLLRGKGAEFIQMENNMLVRVLYIIARG